MEWPAVALIATTVICNVGLWLSLYVSGFKPEIDFGSVPPTLHNYLLGAAAIAYACNLATVVIIATDASAIGTYGVCIATACVGLYYTLQCFFIPMVRWAPPKKSWVRAFLVVAAVPMVVLAAIGIEHARGNWWLPTLALVAAAHAVVNDAVVYGALF